MASFVLGGCPQRARVGSADVRETESRAAPRPGASAARLLGRPGWQGPSTAYTFVEGEQLELHGSGWSITKTKAGKWARDHGSAGKVLSGGGRGEGTASTTIKVADAGRYALWLRLGSGQEATAQLGNANFSVEVSQGGRLLTQSVVDPESEAGIKTPAARHERFRWFKVAVELQPGKVDIKLAKEGKERVGPRARTVDCLLLTRDLAYVPDYRDFDAQVYVRFRVAPASSSSVTFQAPTSTGRVRRGALGRPVAPGAESAWLDATRWLTGESTMRWEVQAISTGANVDYTIDFAIGDSDEPIHATRVTSGDPVTFLMPRRPSKSEPPLADFELASQRAALVDSLPAFDFGKRPTKFPVLTDLQTTTLTDAAEKHVLVYAGLNGYSGLLKADDVANGFVASTLYNVIYSFGAAGHIDPHLPEMESDIKADAARVRASPFYDRVKHLMVIDEGAATKLDKMLSFPAYDVAFKRWMRENRFDPFAPEERRAMAAEGKPPDDLVTLTGRDSKYPGLYYYTQRFRAHHVAEAFAMIKDMVHRGYPKEIRATQNMSDGAVMFANLYNKGNDYFEYFKKGVLDVAMSEDWTEAAADRLLCGWNVALLRAATKYKRQPIHMYVISYSGRKPVEVKLKALSDIAQGAKLLSFFHYAPRYRGYDQGWAEDPPMIAAIGELTREIGASEDVLLDAMPPQAKVGIVYSIPQDIWTANYESTHGNERQLTYLALRHAHVAVDVLSDADVIAGGAGSYSVLYLHGQQIDRRLAEPLAAWVRAGGTLVLGPGAGSRDEWNRPFTALERGLKLTRSPLNVLKVSNVSTRALESLPDGSRVRLPTGEALSAPFVEQSFPESPGLEILARFDSGVPAAIRYTVGRGRVVAFGFLPATEYTRPAAAAFLAHRDERVPVPKLLAEVLRRTKRSEAAELSVVDLFGILPTAYQPAVRELITGATGASRQPRPVDADEPLVEVTLLEGQKGWVVPLGNHSGKPLGKLTVRVRPSKASARFFSSHQGELSGDRQPDDSISFTLPLETTDFLVGLWD